jgi:NADH:ubiquinone reductase (H+-translocating)
MRVPAFDDVWAVGDAAAVPDPANPGSPCPQTAQHAMRQGRLVAANVASTLGRGRSEPFTYKTMGMVVDLGRHNAVASLLGVKVRGRAAFLVARAYHLAALPGWGGRRIRIAGDWLFADLFRLDSSEWGVTDSRPTPLGTAAPEEA